MHGCANIGVEVTFGSDVIDIECQSIDSGGSVIANTFVKVGQFTGWIFRIEIFLWKMMPISYCGCILSIMHR